MLGGKTILICGDRNWTNASIMKKVMDKFVNEKDILVHGNTRGADKMSGFIGKEIGCEVKVFPANWDEHGRSAGPIRNREMLRQNPDIVIGFHNNIEKSKGTKDMLNISKKKGVETYIVTRKSMQKYNKQTK